MARPYAEYAMAPFVLAAYKDQDTSRFVITDWLLHSSLYCSLA
jgi:hypothetical protein